MYAPYTVEEFFDQYGPIIGDFLLALPLVRLFRVLFTRFNNRNRTSHSPILNLPDELLLEVCTIVYLSGCPSWQTGRGNCHGCYGARMALLNLSVTNSRVRSICAPYILTHVRLGRNLNWFRASRSLKAAEHCHYAKKHARRLTLKVDSTCSKETRIPPRDFPSRLALVLPQYESLEKLQIVVTPSSAAALRPSFKMFGVDLPNVRTLVLSSHLEWIIRRCPKVEVISTSGIHWLRAVNGVWPEHQPYDLILAAAEASELRHFEMHETWDRKLLLCALRLMPSIQCLAMPCRPYHGELTDLLDTLSPFDNLKALVLADPIDLDVGYNPSGCGNAYMGPGGQAAREHEAQQRQQAVEYVGELVFDRMSRLEELWVGNYDKATISTNVDGRKEIIWKDEAREAPRDLR